MYFYRMKTVIIIFIVATAVMASPEEFYNVEYDNYDIESIVHNPRTLRNYGNCIISKGACSPEGLEIKKALPEALRTVCGKCTPKQAELVRIVVRAFKTTQPALWNEMVQKLDPKGVYTEAFKNFLHETD